MILVRVEFEYHGDELLAFRNWLLGLIESYRDEPGCENYELLIDPRDPTSHVILEAWADREALEAHTVGDANIEHRALGTLRWGLRGLRVTSWPEAGQAVAAVIDETHAPVSGRDEMNRRIARRLAAVAADLTIGDV